MALDNSILGEAIYEARSIFTNQTYDELITTYGSLEAARLAICKAEAAAIISHFQTSGELHVPALGFMAGTVAVTGNSITGKIQ